MVLRMKGWEGLAVDVEGEGRAGGPSCVEMWRMSEGIGT